MADVTIMAHQHFSLEVFQTGSSPDLQFKAPVQLHPVHIKTLSAMMSLACRKMPLSSEPWRSSSAFPVNFFPPKRCAGVSCEHNPAPCEGENPKFSTVTGFNYPSTYPFFTFTFLEGTAVVRSLSLICSCLPKSIILI